MLGARIAKRFNRSLTAISDDELIAAVLAGQTVEFAELAARYRDKVERLCQRFFSDREMVRDLARKASCALSPGFRRTGLRCHFWAGFARLLQMYAMTSFVADSAAPK